MPVEGLPTTETGTQADSTATASDATAQNTGVQASGAGTQTATTEAATQPQDKTFTQADVDRMFQTRLKSAVKAELKKLTGETDGVPNVDELQRQLGDEKARVRSYEARETVADYLNDGRNKLNIKPENIRGVQELVIPRLEYDDHGKPSNLKEAIETAKAIAPALFDNAPPAGNGAQRTAAPIGQDMNAFIRRAAGFGN